MATAIADSLSAGRSLRASLPAAAGSLDGPPAAELARLGAELDLGAATRGGARRPGAGGCARERVDAFAAALLSQRLAGGDLAGLLRRFAAGAAERDRVAEDARSATAQARFTGLLVVAMPSGGALFAELIQPGFVARLLGLAGRGGAAGPGGGAAARRVRRDQAASRGWSSERRRPAGGAGRAARLPPPCASCCVGQGRSGPVAAARLGLGGRSARAALRLGLPERLRRSGLEARLPLAAVLAAKLAGVACGGLAALAAAPAAPGRTALLVAIALPVAGFLVPDALLEREARRRRRRLLAALPDALDLLAVSAGSGRGPAAGLEQLARAGEGPLAEELRLTVAELVLRTAARAPRCARCAPASPAPSWRPWSRRSSARAASARRWPSSCAVRPAPCAATAAAPSRSAPPAPPRRSSSSSPSSSSPRSC